MPNRRSFLQGSLGVSAGLVASQASAHTLGSPTNPTNQVAARGGYLGYSSGSLSKVETQPHTTPANTPVVTPDVGDLPYTMDDGVKVFELTAHVMQREIAPNKTIDLWGFNGSCPGPTIQVTQGDRVRVIFKNQLPEPSSIHWHGFEDRIGFDGMPGISQEPVKPGEQFIYEFDIHQEGTYFYHSHMAMQEMAGMLGAFIMHPRQPYRPHCEKDFVLHLQEYAVLPNNMVPNTMNMEFNWLLLNGKAGPASTPLIIRQGDRVRIRFVNLGMDHHPMHIHGHTFYITGTEGGRISESAWWPGNTVLVGVAQSRNIEFVADNPGDWMLHCHLPHHMMNQMASQVGPMTEMTSMTGMTRMTRMSGSQMPAGSSMNNGMGMLNGSPGAPLGEDYGPSLGRGMGYGSDAGTSATNGPLSAPALTASMANMGKEMQSGDPEMNPLQMRNMMAMNMDKQSMQQQHRESSPNAGNVPNYPQDAFMEGPMMLMDNKVAKPENYGLRPGWSRFMQGMMTFMRVLPPDQYDDIVDRMQSANRPNDPYASLYQQG